MLDVDRVCFNAHAAKNFNSFLYVNIDRCLIHLDQVTTIFDTRVNFVEVICRHEKHTAFKVHAGSKGFLSAFSELLHFIKYEVMVRCVMTNSFKFMVFLNYMTYRDAAQSATATKYFSFALGLIAGRHLADLVVQIPLVAVGGLQKPRQELGKGRFSRAPCSIRQDSTFSRIWERELLLKNEFQQPEAIEVGKDKIVKAIWLLHDHVVNLVGCVDV